MKPIIAAAIILLVTCSAASSHINESHNMSHPGLLARIDTEGLTKIKEIFLKHFLKKMSFELPNIKVNKLTTTKIKIVKFEIDKADISTMAPDMIKLNLKRGSLKAHVHYKFSLLSGWATIDIGGLGLSLTVRVGKGDYGRLDIIPDECDATIGKLDIRLKKRGWLQKTFNFAVKKLTKGFRGGLQRKICPEIRKFVKQIPQKIYNKRSANIPCFGNTVVNVALKRPPVATRDGIELAVSGRTFNQKLNPHQKFPFKHPWKAVLPSLRHGIAHLALSEHVFNTFLYSLWEMITLKYTKLENKFSSLVGVDMSADKLAGEFPMFEPYRGKKLIYEMEIPEAPRVHFNSKDVTVTFPLELSACITEEDSNKVFHMILEIEIQGKVGIKGDVISGCNSSVNIRSSRNHLPDKFTKFLSRVTKQFMDVIIDMMEKGVKIPHEITDILTGIYMQVEQNVLVLESDLAVPLKQDYKKLKRIATQVINLYNKFKQWTEAIESAL